MDPTLYAAIIAMLETAKITYTEQEIRFTLEEIMRVMYPPMKARIK